MTSQEQKKKRNFKISNHKRMLFLIKKINCKLLEPRLRFRFCSQTFIFRHMLLSREAFGYIPINTFPRRIKKFLSQFSGLTSAGRYYLTVLSVGNTNATGNVAEYFNLPQSLANTQYRVDSRPQLSDRL
jgi:hypothetical protein